MGTATLPISIKKKTLTRRRQNRITVIQNDDGQWIHDVEIIKQLAVIFFLIYTLLNKGCITLIMSGGISL